jgi:hypothetical protein
MVPRYRVAELIATALDQIAQMVKLFQGGERVDLRHCEVQKRRSNPDRRVSLDCFTELVIGPATSGRARWLATTSHAAFAIMTGKR